MAYDNTLAERVRNTLVTTADVVEKEKMGGLSFMLKGKLLIRVQGNELLVRCKPKRTDELLSHLGAKRYQMKGKTQMKGWLLVNKEGTETPEALDFWITVCLDFHNVPR